MRRSQQHRSSARWAAGACSLLAVLAVSACSPPRPEPPAEEPSSAPSPPTLFDGSAATPDVFSQDFGTGGEIGDPVTVAVSEELTGAHMGTDNVGISFEATDLADPRLAPENSALAERLRELGAPALRFGGNRLDRNVFWTSSGEEAPHEDSVTVTPTDLRRLRVLVEDTGSTVTLGIPLGDFDPARGADMAAHAQQILGDSLLAVAVGNEPNGYTVDGEPNHRLRADGWDVAAYQEQLRRYAEAIHERVPELALVGPDAYDAAWMRGFADSGVENRAAIAQHWYALSDCESTQQPGRGPQARNLVSPPVHEAASEMLGIGMDVAEAADLPLWVEEAGPTSCPGTNESSRTQAQALWTVDFALHTASIGVRRLALHSALAPCVGGPPMSVVCADAGEGEPVVGQVGHSALRLAALSTEGDFLEVDVDGADAELRAYAVRDAAGRIVLTVLNLADAAQVSRTPLRISMPDGYAAVEAAQITADSLESVGGTHFSAPAPLPADLPYSGPEEDAPAGGSTPTEGSTATGDEVGAELLDVDASAATVIVLERG